MPEGRCAGCGTRIRPGQGDWCPCLHVSRDEWRRLQEQARVTVMDDECYRSGRRLRRED